jgi:two-component system NtrC family sensor kinase
MAAVEPVRAPGPRLVAYVVAGVVLGALYVVFDVISESRIERGTLTGALASGHAVIDRASPILVGALLGVCAHSFRLRAQLSRTERAASRAEALRTRLLKVERDQAVWVLVAAVLHELNNPLHALGLLFDELAAADDEPTRADLIDRARAQADRALSHLKILRSKQRIGEPQVQRVCLDRLVGALAEDVGSLASQDSVRVRLECERPVDANADPAYVRAIVETLLDNSLHSLRTSGGGSIGILVGVERGHAILRVKDDGPALDPAIRETLFEPLRTTKTQGLGLGLPIARALARSMRGDLVLDDGDAKTFCLELPLGDAS